MRIKIEDGTTVEALALLLEEYARILHQIAVVWGDISELSAEERENIPAKRWRHDSDAAERLSSSLYIACDDSREVWTRSPMDLRESLDIKIRKVKALNDDIR